MEQAAFNHSARFTVFALVAMFIVVTAVNLTKAYHVDDPYHVEMARWIAEHPLEPMSGTTYWSGYRQHYFEGNHPPLFFFGMAAWGSLFGYDEIAMHAFESLFAAAAIFFFHRSARLVVPGGALFLTGLLVLGPAFIVNQNVMMDIPLVAAISALLYCSIQSLRLQKRSWMLGAGAAFAIGLLMKYSMLALAPALMLCAWMIGRRGVWLFVVPVVALVVWSCWNWVEFGAIHILGRSLSPPNQEPLSVRALTWIMTFGAIAPFAFASLIGVLPVRSGLTKITWLVLSITAAFVAWAWAVPMDQAIVDGILRVAFVGNGALGLLAVFSVVLRAWRTRPAKPTADDLVAQRGFTVNLILLVAMLSVAGFVVLFAPWMATRQVLLALPMFLLLMGTWLGQLPKRLKQALLMCTCALGVVLGVSDHRLADFYKATATHIAERYGAEEMWYSGSLGWGWYAASEGLHQYRMGEQTPMAGDVVATPLDMPAPPVPVGTDPLDIDLVRQTIGPMDRFSTRHWLGFYAAVYPGLPWSISHGFPDRVVVIATGQGDR